MMWFLYAWIVLLILSGLFLTVQTACLRKITQKDFECQLSLGLVGLGGVIFSYLSLWRSDYNWDWELVWGFLLMLIPWFFWAVELWTGKIRRLTLCVFALTTVYLWFQALCSAELLGEYFRENCNLLCFQNYDWPEWPVMLFFIPMNLLGWFSSFRVFLKPDQEDTEDEAVTGGW